MNSDRPHPYRDGEQPEIEMVPRIRQIIQSASVEMSTDNSDVSMSEVWDDVIVLVIRTAAKHASDEIDGGRILKLSSEAVTILQKLRDEGFESVEVNDS